MLIKNFVYIKKIMDRGLKLVLKVMQKIVNLLDEKSDTDYTYILRF